MAAVCIPRILSNFIFFCDNNWKKIPNFTEIVNEMLYTGDRKTREVHRVNIYLDSYMATCFWIHLLCLVVTGALTERRNKKNRICKTVAAALLCTAIDTTLTVITVNTGNSLGVPLVFAVVSGEFFLAAGIAYGKRNCIHNGFQLLCMTALLAGVFQGIPIRNAGLFCLVGTILLPVLLRGIATIFRAKQTGVWMYEAKLCQRNEEKMLSAFMDTGNRLRFYGSNLPVVLVDEAYLNEWIKAAEYDMPQKLVFIPYKGVGGKGLLRGVKLRLEVTLREGETVHGEVAAVAAEHRLFRGCDYQMILQPEVLTMKCVTDTQEGVHNVI